MYVGVESKKVNLQDQLVSTSQFIHSVLLCVNVCHNQLFKPFKQLMVYPSHKSLILHSILFE